MSVCNVGFFEEEGKWVILRVKRYQKKAMREASLNNSAVRESRGWDALEIKLKGRGLSVAEVQEARKSFYDGIEVLSKMFLVCYSAEKKKGLDK